MTDRSRNHSQINSTGIVFQELSIDVIVFYYYYFYFTLNNNSTGEVTLQPIFLTLAYFVMEKPQKFGNQLIGNNNDNTALRSMSQKIKDCRRRPWQCV